MKKSIILHFLLWTSFVIGCIANENSEEEKNGYIFTAPRSLKTGANNELQFRRYGDLRQGVITVKIFYQDSYNANESLATEKSYEIEEGVQLSKLNLFFEPFENYVYNGKIVISGTFGDYVINGSDKIYFSASKDNIVFIQTDKPLYKQGQTVKARILSVDTLLKPFADKADIWIEDSSGTRVQQWLKQPLQKGVQQFEFPLADEPVLGDWKISASVNGEVTSTSFEVKEYVLPTYQVIIEIPSFVLADAENIPITVCAKYTYGKSVKGDLRMNISLETYTWSNEKLPSQEFEGKIDGCFNYVINVSHIETEEYYRYRRIQIVASVEEFGTGIQRNETQYVQRQFSPLSLNFNHENQRLYYKPGLPYNGKLFVTHPDGTAAKDEGIQICYTVSRERKLYNWWASKKMKYCENYKSNENGIVEYIIPPQNTDSTGITVEAKSLKYAKEKSKTKSRENSLSQPYTSLTLTPWFSPSGSFIQLQPVQETLLCGSKKSIKLIFTSKTDADFKFYYQVLNKGVIVKNGSVDKSFSMEDDISNQFEDDNKIINEKEFQISPPTESSGNTDTEEESCPSVKETKYVPPIGEVTFDIDIDPNWSPHFFFLVYYIRDDRETVADSQKFKVEQCFKNQIKMQFGDDEKQPGTKTSIKVSASPNSLCGIKVVDKSVSLLNTEDQLTKEKIFNVLESLDTGMYYGINHCNEEFPQPGLYKTSVLPPGPPQPPRPWSSSSYEDSIAAFESAGLLVISDLILFSRPCKSRNGDGINSAYEHTESDYVPYKGGAVAMASTARRPAPRPPPLPTAGLAAESTKSVVEVRDYFPETWLFDLEMTGEDGVFTTKEKLPHTITEWVGNAFCINDEDGLGMSNITTIKGFQAFFLSLTLPYSIVRGEQFWITISVFSYVDDSLPITISLDDLEGFEIISESIDGNICVQPGTSTILKIQLKGTSLGEKNITVRAQTAESSDICGSNSVSDALAKDAITKSLIVEAEGWPAEDIESVLFCPKDEENEIFSKTFSFDAPEDVIPDSARAFLDVTGNVLGKSLDNLENLVRLPTGCGEQNMVKFAPNVVVMNVLVETNQLTDKLKYRIIKNLNTGVQRQLKYKHPDGSFSAFGVRDKEGSMFLTAFVLKYFAEAAKYITIDNSTIVQMQNWITSQQQTNGCFPDRGKIFDRGLQGNIGKEESEGAITAYVLISLLNSGYQNQTVLDLARACIQNSKDTSFYATFLYAYAEALAGEDDSAKKRIETTDGRAITKGNADYYHDVNATKSQDVETAAYAILAKLRAGDSTSNSLRLVQFLTKNMNPQGGFYSTQDTCVGMEALGEFAKLTFKSPLDITITTTGGLEKEIEIIEEEKLIVKRYKISEVPSEISVEAKGSGCAVLQNVLRYNTKTPPEKRSFNLQVIGECLDEPCKLASISIIVSYIPTDKKTGMSIVEVKMISGMSPVRDSLEKLLDDTHLQLMRYDVENNKVVFYFKEITNDEKSFTFNVEEVIAVENSQAGSVKISDYYNQDASSSTSYSLEKCEKSQCSKEL